MRVSHAQHLEVHELPEPRWWLFLRLAPNDEVRVVSEHRLHRLCSTRIRVYIQCCACRILARQWRISYALSIVSSLVSVCAAIYNTRVHACETVQVIYTIKETENREWS